MVAEKNIREGEGRIVDRKEKNYLHSYPTQIEYILVYMNAYT